MYVFFACPRSSWWYLGFSLVLAWRGFSCHRVRALECMGSIVVACGLSTSETCRILVPWPGIQSASPAWEGRFLATGPPGKSLDLLFYFFFYVSSCPIWARVLWERTHIWCPMSGPKCLTITAIGVKFSCVTPSSPAVPQAHMAVVISPWGDHWPSHSRITSSRQSRPRSCKTRTLKWFVSAGIRVTRKSSYKAVLKLYTI